MDQRRDDRLLFRLPEVAVLLGLSRSQTYAMAASGDLPTVRIGRSVRVPANALKAWLDSLEESQE